MNIKISFIITLLLFFNLKTFANVFDYEQNMGYIMQKMPELKDRSCKFTQDKYIQTSNLHIKSSGNFKFEKDKGITFYITYPTKTTVSYSNSEYRQINNIIKAISNKNYKKLEADFKFYFEEKNGLWNFALKPKTNSKVSAYISSVEISGKNDISKIIITAFDKTKTTITFLN